MQSCDADSDAALRRVYKQLCLHEVEALRRVYKQLYLEEEEALKCSFLS